MSVRIHRDNYKIDTIAKILSVDKAIKTVCSVENCQKKKSMSEVFFSIENTVSTENYMTSQTN